MRIAFILSHRHQRTMLNTRLRWQLEITSNQLSGCLLASSNSEVKQSHTQLSCRSVPFWWGLHELGATAGSSPPGPQQTPSSHSACFPRHRCLTEAGTGSRSPLSTVYSPSPFYTPANKPTSQCGSCPNDSAAPCCTDESIGCPFFHTRGGTQLPSVNQGD